MLELLPQLQANDNDAWSQVYQEMLPQLRGYFVNKGVAGYDDREELVQETLIQVSQDINQFDVNRSENLQSWIFGIADNRLRRYYGNQPHRKNHLEWDELTDEDAWDLGLIDDFDEVDEEIDERLEIDEARRLFGLMTEDEAQLVQMRHEGGFTWEEIGEVFGLSRTGAQSKYQRLMERLQAASLFPNLNYWEAQ